MHETNTRADKLVGCRQSSRKSRFHEKRNQSKKKIKCITERSRKQVPAKG